MAFESLSDRLQESLKKIRGQSVLTDENMEDMLREIRLALLEADVNFNVVKELETIDKKLFNRFKEYNNIDNIDTYLLTILNINEVVKCIKFGVTIKENMRRRFELFDYFKLLSINISEYNKCLDIAFKVLDKYDYKVLETFIINHKNISLNDEENAILSMRVVEDDKIIDNNLKISIINIMKVHGVPVTRKLFNQALRKYLDGELVSNKRII